MIGRKKKTTLKPLPESKIMAQSENFRLIQSYKYNADWCWQGAENPYEIIPYWYVEKKNKNAIGEIFWAAYENNPQIWGSYFCKEFMCEYFKLMNPNERIQTRGEQDD